MFKEGYYRVGGGSGRDVFSVSEPGGMVLDIPYHGISGVFFEDDKITIVCHHPEVRATLLSDEEKDKFIKWWENG